MTAISGYVSFKTFWVMMEDESVDMIEVIDPDEFTRPQIDTIAENARKKFTGKQVPQMREVDVTIADHLIVNAPTTAAEAFEAENDHDRLYLVLLEEADGRAWVSVAGVSSDATNGNPALVEDIAAEADRNKIGDQTVRIVNIPVNLDDIRIKFQIPRIVIK